MKECPNCGLENQPEMHFCGKCGHELTASSLLSNNTHSLEEKLARIQHYLPEGLTKKILAQKDRIEGERRQVTIMFCDMKGFTPLTHKLGPEETFRLMEKVLKIMVRNVHQYEGTVNDIRGDGIIALFGALDALEDAPQRAIRASIDIHKGIVEFNRKMKDDHQIPPIRLRIGINTGTVVLGTVEIDLRVQFTLVGDTINMASRLEAIAEPGTTYVAENTYQLTKGLFHFQPVGKKVVKGKEEPISVYQVLSAKEDVYRLRLGSERLIYSRLVGRDSELNKLELQVMKAINGQGSVINIIGEAGIGKSRLLAELKNREVMKRVTLLEGRAISIGKNLSFHPIIDLLRQWADIRNEDGEDKAFDKLQVAVRRLFREDYNEILPFVAILMGMKLSGIHARRAEGIEGEALQRLILKSVRDLLVKTSERTPLVMVIDDLHWADTSSIELMESLFRLAETHRIFFINLFRPGYQETGDFLAESLKDPQVNYYFEMALEPLPGKMSEALIGNMLNFRDLPQAFVNRIVEMTGGNPFFIEEVVRSLIDEQVILPKGGRFHLTDKAATISIPNTIEALLMARIDRLEEQTRDLVKEASVIGRSFFYRILAKVASKIENIEARLTYLQEIQLLLERLRMGELEYLFKHALAQEVAYESILPQRRKELHLKVAQAIETVFEKRLYEFYGMLAYHYCQAESLEEAEECLIKAGGEALRSSASDEALHYYEEALQIYMKKSTREPSPEKVAMLEKNIALALYNRGQHQEAINHFEKALDYYWGKIPKGTVFVTFKLLSALGHFFISLYLPSLKFKKTPTDRDVEIVELFFKKVKSILITHPKRAFAEIFYLFKFISSFDLRRFNDGYGIFLYPGAVFVYSGISFKLSKKVLDTVKNNIKRNDVINYTNYELIETVYDFFGGNWNSITDYDDILADENCRIGEIYNISFYLYWHAIGKICQGDFNKAGSFIKRLDDLSEVLKNDLSKTLKSEANTWLLIESDKLDEAMKESEKGIAFEEKALSGFWALHICQAWIHMKRQAIQEAEEAIKRADIIRRQAEAAPFQLSPQLKIQLDLDLYHLKESIKEGNQAEIKAVQDKAFKSGKLLYKVSRKIAFHRTDSYRLMGIYYWTINKHKKALQQWHKAVQEGEHLGARPQLARLYLEIGRCLLEDKGKYKELDGLSGETYLEKARSLYEEMGMESSLEEIDRVLEMRTL